MFSKKFSLLLISSIIITIGLLISLGSFFIARTNPFAIFPGRDIITSIFRQKGSGGIGQFLATPNCFQQEKRIIKGDSMAPLLANGDEVLFLSGYYQCGYPVEKGDLVAYNFAGNENPLLKIVKATSADKIEIFGEKMKVNGEFLKNSQGEDYVFTEKQLAMMQLYIKKEHLPPASFFIFGDNIIDSKDSRRFGAVSARDFLGKFVVE